MTRTNYVSMLLYNQYLLVNILVLLLIGRALRSRSLRDGSLPHKGRFATFVRSFPALRASKRPLKIFIFEINMIDYPIWLLESS